MDTIEQTFNYEKEPCLATEPSDKDIFNCGAQQYEPSYVDLNGASNSKKEGTKTVKVIFTGDGSQLDIFKNNGDEHAGSQDKTPDGRIFKDNAADLPNSNSKSSTKRVIGNGPAEELATEVTDSFKSACSSEISDKNEDFRDCPESPTDNIHAVPESTTEIVPRKSDTETQNNKEEMQCTDTYCSRKTEPEDCVGVVSTDHCMPGTAEDESHFITTHEIQLSELDHDADYDFGMGSCWDIEDDNLVYSFVDYASFDSTEIVDGRRDRTVAKVKSNQAQSNNTARRANGGAAVSTKPENDLCHTNKCVSSDESLSKNQDGSGSSTGQIHLSIRTTSRTINEPNNVQEKENIRCHAKHEGDMSRYVLRGADTKAEKICDSAKCFIAAPGRVHFGAKLKGKDVHDYSSGASSAVSELDDADKEVRNLTARAFKSLACPYFDAINFSTSSESSASEHALGINRWSAFVDVKYDMRRARDQNPVSHKSATSTFEISKNGEGKGMKGLSLANIKAPQTKMFALNGKLSDPKNASSSTKKIELMGKFGKGQGGVIRLTETLNFRCNVKAGVPGGERRAKFAQNAAGSSSTDEVTCIMPRALIAPASRQPCNAGVTMDGAQKKAIFASSLIKNVISKKIQFEQERKMERGEISEPLPAPSPSFTIKVHELHKERSASVGNKKAMQRQSSKLSETGSELTVVCVDEAADTEDSSSRDPKEDAEKEDTSALLPGTNLDPTNEAGFDTKKGAFEVSKSTLLRSQNSAFRSWKEGEPEFQKERKNAKSPAEKAPSSTDNLGKSIAETEVGGSRLTKMSHLFVSSINVPTEDSGIKNASTDSQDSTRRATDPGGDAEVRSDSTLCVADAARRIVTQKSPEIKISLRSVDELKCNQFNIAKLLTPNIGCSALNTTKPADDSKCQALLAASLKVDSAEKGPHFMVRDIRDNKCKLQTPIHQVRDVRKLVKSSYNFVSSDNENKCAIAADPLAEHKATKPGPCRNASSSSPIVIKCQSVNTNSNAKPGNLIEVSKRRPADNVAESERCSPQLQTEVAKNENILVNPSTTRACFVTAQQLNGDASEVSSAVKTETMTAKRKQDKTTDNSEKKPESKMANQAALEKLQAAVKTMEQLYVFDRNEWKRKSEPRRITDSHVLSLIASEEHGALERVELDDEYVVEEHCLRSSSCRDGDGSPPAAVQHREDKEHLKVFHNPCGREERDGVKPQLLQGGAPGSKSQSHRVPVAGSCKGSQPYTATKAPFGTKMFAAKGAKGPKLLKILQPKEALEEREKSHSGEAERPVPQQPGFTAVSDSENYLTIPVKARGSEAKPTVMPVREQAVYTFTAAGAQHRAGSPTSHDDGSGRSPKRSTVVVEPRSPDTPTATIYHHPLPIAMQGPQPQVICLSPPMAPAGVIDPFQVTQRKMLLDPTTGQYYLVDTPVQPATRRLFDPETGQYVDVPIPQTPMAPMPMPMPMAPLTLNPATYGPTYMIYPGFLSTPPIMQIRNSAPPLSVRGESEEGDPVPHTCPQGDSAYLESPYYIHTGKAPQSQYVTTRGAKEPSNGKPIISITSQQGPRIIAPPSFDGTTMSFVMEHK